MTTTKSNRISREVARALAEQAWKILVTKEEALRLARPQAAKKSKTFKSLLELNKQLSKLQEKKEALERAIKREFPGVGITTKYDKENTPVPYYHFRRPDIKRLTGLIMAANQVDGVAPEKLVNTVVTKLLTSHE
jgi:hypothetical protein